MTGTLLLWLRNDLRLTDHPALAAALAKGCRLLPVYVLDDAAPGPWACGGASRWWLHHSLVSLGGALDGLGSRLVLRRGSAATLLPGLAAEIGAAAVFCTRAHEPWAARQETAVAAACADAGVAFHRFPGATLHEPETPKTGAGKPFRVFTPFARACRALGEPRMPLPRPPVLPALPAWPESDALADWGLAPAAPDWAAGFADVWQPGEDGAEARLARFLETALSGYATLRDRPDLAGTSRLSPHLHFGEISPRRCWHAAAARLAATPEAASGAEAFLRELLWREFSRHLLHHAPDLPEAPFRPEFAAFPWRDDPRGLQAWQRGLTGVPMVDAGMRELWSTGWMHNRVRMITASFLVKNLMIHWRHGEAWFRDTLVDADLASNAANWQWVAGCGADAAPYFRIFNHVLQGRKFDPQADYVRRFVPELRQLPDSHIHAPWEAPPMMLRAAGVVLGQTYPLPIAGLAESRDRALTAYRSLMGKAGAADLQPGPE